MENVMKLEGIVKSIGETQDFNGFKKRELVLVTGDDQYPQTVLIEFVQDKTKNLNHYKEGDSVAININIRGREWTNPQGEVKVFNSIQGWYIEEQGKSAPAVDSDNEKDELPF